MRSALLPLTRSSAYGVPPHSSQLKAWDATGLAASDTQPIQTGTVLEGHGTAHCGRAQDRELGRGRSGIVYQSQNDAGLHIARKVFGSSGLSKLVQYILLGSPNPYVWCEAAVHTAVLRRRILAALADFWFGGTLRVACAYEYRWNTRHRSYEMDCELITGRHLALHHAYTAPGDGQLRNLLRGIMKPLQARLAEAGLDGLVWQAGRGNPVALNNFMWEGLDADGGDRWVWIDLESGIPAVIPINPWDFFLFYLPKCVRHRHVLFDDIDINRLRDYAHLRRQALTQKIGEGRLHGLDADIAALAQSQRQWKSMVRYRRSIAYRHIIGSITTEQADGYADHPWRWYCTESKRALSSAVSATAAGACRMSAAIKRVDLGRIARACWSAIRSQRFREDLAKNYVTARIAHWQVRAQLTDRHAEKLRDDLGAEEGSAYLADFGTHLAVKPFVKTVEFWLLPMLWVMGVIGERCLGIALISIGPATRTFYTLYRLVQNTLAGREKPWTALCVGTVPVLGNLAYPLQIIRSGGSERGAVAHFILYDTFSRFGQWFPIWGGSDTLIEHLLNRCPDLAIRSLPPATSSQPDETPIHRLAAVPHPTTR